MKQRLRIEVTGRVQGVGFRPTIYRHAHRLQLAGSVRNTPAGVSIEIEGAPTAIAHFLALLKKQPPRQARLDSLRLTELTPLANDENFRIEPSAGSGDLRTGLPPDLAICAECQAELFTPTNRRHQYAFSNCTNCGPRFTIIRALPYDRERTTMAAFQLCAACQAEYTDPADRRFEAQPNACPRCGPQLSFRNAAGPAAGGDALTQAMQLLRAGRVLAVKGLGGYHLSCDARSDQAVARLRARKNRPSKSLAVMFASLDEIRQHCLVNAAEAEALQACSAPIVILKRRPSSSLARDIAPDTGDIGALLPYTPLHQMLLAQLSPLVMTSGNRAEEPIAYNSAQLEELLSESADGALDHNRPILRRCDDSVLKIVREQPLILRRSRGLVPDPISLPLGEATVLACGADLKNVIGVTRARELFLSQHIGDLEDWRAFDFFRATITDFLALLRVRPALVVHDLHPAYHSTRYAQTPEAPPAPRLAVQHHHAHIAACMAEHQLTQPLIGVALDGTGYGADGTLWGGEFLSADLDGYRRLAHFKAYPLPGGAAAIQQPARMAFSMLQAELPPQEADQIAASQLDYSAEECAALRALMQARGHAPLSSSAGRLFDAVAALLGLGTEISYEARGAIRLQSLADPNANGHYPFRLIAPAAAAETAALPRPSVLSFGPMLQALIAEQRAGVDPARLAGKFHNTMARAVVQVCIQIQAAQGLKAVALSGGVFQNELLLDKVRQGLLQEGFQVYSHRVVPPNDGGIALGQAALGLQWMARRPQLANSNH